MKFFEEKYLWISHIVLRATRPDYNTVLHFIMLVKFGKECKLAPQYVMFSLLSLFWKNKIRLMRSSWCLCIPRINFWMPEPLFMKLGMYIMAAEPISIPPISLCVNTCIIARQRVCKIVTEAMNIHAKNRRFYESVVFYTICVVSKENKRLVLPRTSCFSYPVPSWSWSKYYPQHPLSKHPSSIFFP
jgi:hypothetical protein